MKKTDIIIAKALLAWYGRNLRILPWRKPEKDTAQDQRGPGLFTQPSSLLL
jgi:adenine-specific DNA glycosylase